MSDDLNAVITAADGHSFAAYRAAPKEARRGGLVILHAIWGVTPHLRELADTLSEQGYEALVPSLLDRFQERLGAGPDANASDIFSLSDWGARCVPDVQACIDALEGPVFIMGFCLGGTVAWLAAGQCDGVAAASCFYGGHIVRHLDQGLRCPTILHFGKKDHLIPLADVERIVEARPDLPVFLYEASHAFVAPGDRHEPDSAKLAMLRTLQHFHRSAGAKGEMGG